MATKMSKIGALGALKFFDHFAHLWQLVPFLLMLAPPYFIIVLASLYNDPIVYNMHLHPGSIPIIYAMIHKL